MIHTAMTSVENFYWILFENLLKPVGMDAWYFYPFGTKQHLSKYEFGAHSQGLQQPHVLFHFDQEPILEGKSWNDYDKSYNEYWSSRIFRVLANSEHSAVKQQICKQRAMSDWYFFYHGFAALDWYQDTQYIKSNHPIKNAFLSFNHTLESRSYRLALVARLLKKNIANKGLISFHATRPDIEKELCKPDTGLSLSSQALVQNHMESFSGLPWKVDDVPIAGDLSARFGCAEYKLWQRSLWHVVNETVFYDPKLHLTEKIFKPIVAQRPFILVAAPGNLAYLRSYGFKTFDRWIDESYDQIQDPDARLDAVAVEISRFAHMDLKALEDMHQDMLPTLEFNKQHFFGQFREIIVDELINNFDTCVRSWNNGRVDGRELAVPRDLELVKKVLLR